MTYGSKELAASFRTVRSNTIKIAEEIPESKYDFRAAPDTRSIGGTLVHIALASLWIMPVIAAGTMTRVIFLAASAALHLALSKWFYFEYAWHRPVIDGGPLGFLSWSIPMLVGSLAYDAVAGKS